MLFNSGSLFNSTSVPWFNSTAFTSGTNVTWYINQKPDDGGDDSGGGALIPRRPRPPKGSPGTTVPLPDRELVGV